MAEDLQAAQGSLRVSALDDVLAWGCAFLGRTGDWPAFNSGPIPEAPGETWLLIAAALSHGLRGLPQTRSLERLFGEHQGRFDPADLRLSAEKILDWADAWLERTGDWPTCDSGVVVNNGRLNWRLIDRSLRAGGGDVPGGSSLADFLASRRGAVQTATFRGADPGLGRCISQTSRPLADRCLWARRRGTHRKLARDPTPHSL